MNFNVEFSSLNKKMMLNMVQERLAHGVKIFVCRERRRESVASGEQHFY